MRLRIAMISGLVLCSLLGRNRWRASSEPRIRSHSGRPQAAAFPADLAPDSYRLGVNDSIQVRCVNVDEFGDTPVRIDTDGQISLPLIGRVQAAGLTVKQLEEALTEAPGYLRP